MKTHTHTDTECAWKVFTEQLCPLDIWRSPYSEHSTENTCWRTYRSNLFSAKQTGPNWAEGDRSSSLCSSPSYTPSWAVLVLSFSCVVWFHSLSVCLSMVISFHSSVLHFWSWLPWWLYRCFAGPLWSLPRKSSQLWRRSVLFPVSSLSVFFFQPCLALSAILLLKIREFCLRFRDFTEEGAAVGVWWSRWWLLTPVAALAAPVFRQCIWRCGGLLKGSWHSRFCRP